MIAVDANVLARFYRDDPEDAVKDAIDLHRRGIDFADALHLTSSAACSAFVTFDDRKFVRRARRLGLIPRVELPAA